MFRFDHLPPLSLYVHFPWCVRKCPYCDFNSHPLKDALPEAAYIEALLADLEHDLPRVWGRRVQTVFLGGGTPSLISPSAIDRLLSGIRARIALAPDAEITLEANPGATDQARFVGYRAAGVNRLSIGIQSFDDGKLAALGRIHGREEALHAIAAARAAGFDNLNLDLMVGLPGQTPDEARADLGLALAQAPAHLSVYQLTLEPNTPFHARPPALPDEESLDAIQALIGPELAGHGFHHYEVSAYALAGRQSRHNRNYWEFGDYLGLGAGAHAKITEAGAITRLAKRQQPQDYLAHAGTPAALAAERRVTPGDAVFEFMLNALRLSDGVPLALFRERTGLPPTIIESRLSAARQRGLLAPDDDCLRPTPLGQRFLNDLTGLFLPDSGQRAGGGQVGRDAG
jgi:oxygen-independent coproporphyrinogen-3 oxidase